MMLYFKIFVFSKHCSSICFTISLPVINLRKGLEVGFITGEVCEILIMDNVINNINTK